MPVVAMSPRSEPSHPISSNQEAASCSSDSARGLKRRRLLATEALLETSEDLVGRNGRDSAGIDVSDSTLDFRFPVLPEISKLQTCRKLVTGIPPGFQAKQLRDVAGRDTCMPRPLRFIPEHSLVEITTRTIQGRLLLKPSPELNELILGIIGRRQDRKYHETPARRDEGST